MITHSINEFAKHVYVCNLCSMVSAEATNDAAEGMNHTVKAIMWILLIVLTSFLASIMFCITACFTSNLFHLAIPTSKLLHYVCQNWDALKVLSLPVLSTMSFLNLEDMTYCHHFIHILLSELCGKLNFEVD